MKSHATCQICGRAIRANTGIIAHHGYKRPGQGWQTSSCPGAKKLPYEVSRAQIPPTIEAIERYKAGAEAALKGLLASPPETLTFQRRDAWGKPLGEPRVYKRPEGFDPLKKVGSYSAWSYESVFYPEVSTKQRQITAATHDIESLHKRYDAWVEHKFVVVDEEVAERKRHPILGYFVDHDEGADWLSAHKDQAKVERGGFGLDAVTEALAEEFASTGGNK